MDARTPENLALVGERNKIKKKRKTERNKERKKEKKKNWCLEVIRAGYTMMKLFCPIIQQAALDALSLTITRAKRIPRLNVLIEFGAQVHGGVVTTMASRNSTK
uniref:Uncharacterized protein n=1 Tax=Vespula pensylvanica TaxID=30213 RepID=A0A834KNV5_VESPE|nr:hypothetical protein H0235_014214 [Vespula pensylvanica]